jgi:Domain of unknown function (DUF4124)
MLLFCPFAEEVILGNVYKYVRADGTTGYSDQPPADATSVARVDPSGRAARNDEEAKKAHDEAVAYIKEAQKRIPKLKDYWDYLEFLRSYDPIRFRRVMDQLMAEDREAWVKLQKYPQFRALRDTALGRQAANKHITAGIGFVSGKYTGSIEKWLETSVQDLMKQQRWGPYADVLGAKASTLPPAPAPSYSNSRLGQYLKEEDARLTRAAKQVGKAVEESRAAIRTGVAAAISRPGNVLLDLGLGALNPQVHGGFTNATIEIKLKKALASGALDEDQYITAHNLMSQGKYKEMQDYLQSLGGGRK